VTVLKRKKIYCHGFTGGTGTITSSGKQSIPAKQPIPNREIKIINKMFKKMLLSGSEQL
jgi:hypothetical protein